MTTVAERLPVCVTTAATGKTNSLPIAVANKFFSDFFQQIHVMESHVLSIPNTLLVLRIRHLEEGL
jgi:hypothetical protein